MRVIIIIFFFICAGVSALNKLVVVVWWAYTSLFFGRHVNESTKIFFFGSFQSVLDQVLVLSPNK